MSPWQPAVRQGGDPSINNPSLGQELPRPKVEFPKAPPVWKAGTNGKQLLCDVMTFIDANQSECKQLQILVVYPD